MSNIWSFFLNKVWTKTSIYKRQFANIGHSRIEYPYILSVNRFHKSLLSIGDMTWIAPHSRIETYPQYIGDNPPPMITIGNNCSIGYYFTILAGASVTIDNDVLIASNVLITSENHGIDVESGVPYMNQCLNIDSVHIKSNCWIGEKVCILPGVTIGEGSIIGAASVVTHDVPNYSIAVGNPARVIKRYSFTSHMWESVSGDGLGV